MNTPENNVDLHIDHALESLRDAHPRPGLDLRILHALETLEAHRNSLQPARSSLRLIHSVPLAAWLASGTLALAILAALLLPHHEHPAPSATATSTALSRPSLAVPHPERSAAEPRTPVLEASQAPHSASIATTRYPKTSGSSLSTAKKIEGVLAPGVTAPVITTPSEAALLADLHTPSHPAPPLPLSPQEKALLRLLRYSNATQIASLNDLNPTVRSARDAAEAADFHDFFNPPLPPQPGDTE